VTIFTWIRDYNDDNDIAYTEGRIFSWGKSSRGRLGREASSNDDANDTDGCPSMVTVNAAAADGDDDVTSRHLQVTSLCCSHGVSLVCITQRKLS